MLTIKNLIGFDLRVAGVVIPGSGVRAVIPTPQVPAPVSYVQTSYGDLPVGTDFMAMATLADVVMSDGSQFPDPVENVVILAPLPVRNAALRAGRTDVWGMGDRASQHISDGVKHLVR